MENKICPFSMPFSIRQMTPLQIPNQLKRINIQIGLPCIGPKCVLWDEEKLKCGLIVIKDLLEYIAYKERSKDEVSR